MFIYTSILTESKHLFLICFVVEAIEDMPQQNKRANHEQGKCGL